MKLETPETMALFEIEVGQIMAIRPRELCSEFTDNVFDIDVFGGMLFLERQDLSKGFGISDQPCGQLI